MLLAYPGTKGVSTFLIRCSFSRTSHMIQAAVGVDIHSRGAIGPPLHENAAITLTRYLRSALRMSLLHHTNL